MAARPDDKSPHDKSSQLNFELTQKIDQVKNDSEKFVHGRCGLAQVRWLCSLGIRESDLLRNSPSLTFGETKDLDVVVENDTRHKNVATTNKLPYI